MWSERCRCGRFAVLSLTHCENLEKTAPMVVKHWFDKEGNFEKTTGTGITSNGL